MRITAFEGTFKIPLIGNTVFRLGIPFFDWEYRYTMANTATLQLLPNESMSVFRYGTVVIDRGIFLSRIIIIIIQYCIIITLSRQHKKFGITA